MTTTDELILQTAREIFTDLVASGAARVADGDWAEQAWKVIADTGLLRVGVPESAGGEGGSYDDAAALLAIAGEFALPLPVAENALLAGWLLESAGLTLPAGPGPVTVAPGRAGDTIAAEESAKGWTVGGQLARVPWAGQASHLVALVPVVGKPGSFATVLIARSSYDVVAGQNLAGERRDLVLVSGAQLSDTEAAISTVTPAALLRRGAISRSVLIAGALRRVLSLTVDYANTRVQFGRPIAKFQAVSQHLARLAEESALAEIAAGLGINSLSTGAGEAGIAKSSCGRAAGEGSRLAHQVHGAIGVTEEYELQRLTRRLLAWRDEYGAESYWDTLLGAGLLQAGSAHAWDVVTGSYPSLGQQLAPAQTGSPS